MQTSRMQRRSWNSRADDQTQRPENSRQTFSRGAPLHNKGCGQRGTWTGPPEAVSHVDDRQDGGRLQQDVSFLKKKLNDAERFGKKLQAQLAEATEKIRRRTDELRFLKSTQEEMEAKYNGNIVTFRDLKQASTMAEELNRDKDKQIASLQQRLLQAENREKVLQEEVEEVGCSEDLMESVDRETCEAKNRSRDHRASLYELQDAQSALKDARLKRSALEKALRGTLAENDELRRQELLKREGLRQQELSQREGLRREELSKREGLLREELSQREGVLGEELSNQKRRHSEELGQQKERFELQLAEKREAFRRLVSEQEQRLQEKLAQQEAKAEEDEEETKLEESVEPQEHQVGISEKKKKQKKKNKKAVKLLLHWKM